MGEVLEGELPPPPAAPQGTGAPATELQQMMRDMTEAVRAITQAATAIAGAQARTPAARGDQQGGRDGMSQLR